MQDLIERLEKATGPDMQLDAVIRQVCDLSPVTESGLPCTPCYTASIDAALTLVPEGWIVNFDIRPDCGTFCWLHSNDLVKQTHSPGAFDINARVTPAIALCIAALKARSTTAHKAGD